MFCLTRQNESKQQQHMLPPSGSTNENSIYKSHLLKRLLSPHTKFNRMLEKMGDIWGSVAEIAH